MAPSCFQPPLKEDDSIVLFSTSDSNEESSSSSSSCHHYSPPPPTGTYQLNVTNLSYSVRQNKPLLSSTIFKRPPPQVSTPNNNRHPRIDILKSVSFTAKSSEILAVVGPSGTGKSTLLRIISGRIPDGHFTPNTISLNHRPITTPSQLRAFCGYVAQEDDLLPLLTVKETLMFGAKFRLTKTMSTAAEKEERVHRLMQELGLLHVADSFVGDEEHRGISGGERKRVSIGVDMIHEPPVLVLDEPTSGLDSTSALQVIELLSTMARNKHRTVLISIHQPSYRILRHVSSFLILSGGKGVHNGGIVLLEQRISRLGYEIPAQLNPLEFAMEIIDKLEEESYHDHSKEEPVVRNRPPPPPPSPYELHDREFKDAGGCGSSILSSCLCYDYCLEIAHLCSRFWKVIYRTKQLFLARTMQALVGGFGLGSVYVNIRKHETVSAGGSSSSSSGNDIAERLGLFAFSLSFLLSSTVEALPIYLQERRVLMKESSRKAYKMSSYMIANTVVFLPFLLVVALLFSVPVYWIVGLNPSLPAFAFFVFTVWNILLMASSLVLFLSAVSPDFISGNSLIGTVLGTFFLFSGYFIPKEIIPKYWMFMYYVSIYRYPLDCFVVNEYWSRKDDCFVWQQTGVVNGTGGGMNQCLMTGMDALRGRGLEKDSRWINVGIMFGFFLFYRVICCIILARRASKTII